MAPSGGMRRSRPQTSVSTPTSTATAISFRRCAINTSFSVPRRTLSFNDELLGMERDLGDYVIVHELLHFSVPNHGKLWKSLMRAYLGDYEHIAARLRRAAPDG